MTNADLNEKLQRAEVFLGGGTLAQKQQAKEWLNEIIAEAPGTPIAGRAHEMLVGADATAAGKRAGKWDRQIRELRKTWQEIQAARPAFAHPALPSFIEKLFDSRLGITERATQLRKDTIEKLTQWIAEKTDEFRHASPGETDSSWQGRRIKRIAKAIHAYPGFERGLSASVEEWALVVFSEKFQETSAAIQNVLAQWNADEAQQLFDKLEIVPARLRDQANTLQREIDEVKANSNALAKLLARFPGPKPETWPQLYSLTERKQALEKFQGRPLPSDKRKKIQDSLSRFSDHAGAFLTGEAEKCDELQKIRIFWKEYSKLNEPLFPDKPDVFAWFAKPLQEKEHKVGNKAASVSSVEELARIHQQLREESKGLPPGISDNLKNYADAIAGLADQWQAMQTGMDFSEPAKKDPVTIPPAFKKEIGTYRKVWNKLRDIEHNIRPADEYPAEANFKQAEKQLTGILAKHPQHQYARQLQVQTQQGRLRCRFDAALHAWDMEKFIRVCRQPAEHSDAVSHYLQLAKHEKGLQRLRPLAESPALSSAFAARTWWAAWKRALSILPPPAELPAAFLDRLEETEEQRKEEWFALLETLFASRQTRPSACREAAAALLVCLEDPDPRFRQYHRRLTILFLRKETEEAITAMNWQTAQQSLAKFKENHGTEEEAQHLEALLEIRQAHAQNPGALADLLWEKWEFARKYLAPEIPGLLCEAMAENRRLNVDLSHLRALAQRLSQQEISQPPLYLWLEWLDLEQLLLPDALPDTMTIQRLVKLIFTQRGKTIPETLRAPVEDWFARLQNTPDSLLFIWFYHACEHVRPPLARNANDPLEAFTQASVNRATQLQQSLKSMKNISEEDLRKARATLKTEYERWHVLENYFAEIPFETRIQKPALPQMLNGIENDVNDLWSVQQEIAYLEDTDLREQQNKWKIREIDNLASNKLDAFPLQNELERIKALQSLSGLAYELNRFRDISRRCGSCAPGDLDERDLFVKMRKTLDNIIKLFENAKLAGRGMWQRLSEECCHFARQEAGVLVPRSPEPDLRILFELLQTLADEEKIFRAALIEVAKRVPPVHPSGKIDAANPVYQGFFNQFPTQAPRTRRSYHLFDRRIARLEPMCEMLRQGRKQIPVWICSYLDEGIPLPIK
ncbi:MAG: hypothetical protein GY862_30140 [Gammaproteobacteria bacterium]|nr:hypothetical protein [Gammaproteobacteria bacterium]